MYKVYVTKVKNIRKAENADKLNLCEVFGNTVVVDKNVNETDLYVYFPIDGQISIKFGEKNNLFRKKDENGNSIGGFIDPDKRNIRALRLRGNKSEGLLMPLTSLVEFGDISTLKQGDTVEIFNGVQIAEKYVPKVIIKESKRNNNNQKSEKAVKCKLFKEHIDTEQLNYNLDAFKVGDLVELTLKMHGTSGRTAYLPVQRKMPQNKIQKFFKMKPKVCVINEYISGTRRTVIQESQGDDFTGGFYGSDNFRKTHHNTFVDKLSLGETVYYEIVGYTDCGGAIMASGVNKKVSKEFEKQYGKITEFSYGCDPEGVNAPKSDLYVYRITMTTEDGRIIEYSPTQIQVRCEELGVKSVPVFETFQIKDEDLYALESEITNEYIYETPGEYVKKMVDKYVDGPDPIGKTHVREGVVARILNRNGFKVYKDKNYDFKVLSGIITESVSEKDTIDETVLEEM